MEINIFEKPDFCPQCNMTKKEFQRRLGKEAYDSLVKLHEITPEIAESLKASGYCSAPVVSVQYDDVPDNSEREEHSDNRPETWAGYRPDYIRQVSEIGRTAVILAGGE